MAQQTTNVYLKNEMIANHQKNQFLNSYFQHLILQGLINHLMLLKSTQDMSGFFILIEICYLKLPLSLMYQVKSVVYGCSFYRYNCQFYRDKS